MVLIKVVGLQLQSLLVVNDKPHEINSGIVLARIFLLFGLDDHLRKENIVRGQLDIEHFGTGSKADALGLVADSREGERVPSFTGLYLVFTVAVGNATYALALVLHRNVHQGFMGQRVGHYSFDLRLDDEGHQHSCQHA